MVTSRQQALVLARIALEVLANPEFTALPRDLDLVELWSGVGSIVAAATKRNLKAVPFDKNRHPVETAVSEDILSPALNGLQRCIT